MTKRNIVTDLMNEYIAWGGPIVTRAEARADMLARGFDAKAIDVCVFGRRSVEAPADPAAHVAFLRQIQQLDGIGAVAAAA